MPPSGVNAAGVPGFRPDRELGSLEFCARFDLMSEYEDIPFRGMIVRSFDRASAWDKDWFESLKWGWGQGKPVEWRRGLAIALHGSRCGACVKYAKVCIWDTKSS